MWWTIIVHLFAVLELYNIPSIDYRNLPYSCTINLQTFSELNYLGHTIILRIKTRESAKDEEHTFVKVHGKLDHMIDDFGICDQKYSELHTPNPIEL